MSEGSRHTAYWRWAAAVFVIAMILVWIYQAHNRSNGTPPAPQPHLLNGGGARMHGPFRIGDRVALGSYGVTVAGFTDPLRVQSGPLTPPLPPGHRYVLVRVALSNLGTAKLRVNATDTVILVDGRGRHYSASLFAPGGIAAPPPTSLASHATQRGELVFTLPDTARPVAVLFEPGSNPVLLDTPMPDYGHVRIGLQPRE